MSGVGQGGGGGRGPGGHGGGGRGGWVSVVGTVNRDVVLGEDGRRHESLGGILYNALVLAALLDGTGIGVRAHGRLGADDRREAERLAAGWPALDPAGLVADPAGTNLSTLDYRDGPERREDVTLRVAPLSPRDLAGAVGARAVLVNMISGEDVALETLGALRAGTDALFLLDVQALARGTGSPRRPRRVPDWRVWARTFDVVRGNEREIAWFGGCPDDPLAAARAVLAAGAGEVLVTRGDSGGVRLAPGSDGRVRAHPWDAVVCAGPVDSTGCGDAFLSGYCAGRVLDRPPDAAVRLGAFVAAEVAGLAGLAALDALAGVRERADERFGPPEEPERFVR